MTNKLFPEYPVLVIDDEVGFLNSIDFELRSHGITNIEKCQDSGEVLTKLEVNKYSIILLDLLMPDISGDELLPLIVELYPETPVIIVTATPETDSKTAYDYMKNGAYDYLTKPLETEELVKTIRDAWELRDIYKEIIPMKKNLFSKAFRKSRDFPNIISQSNKLQELCQTIGIIAVTSKPVLIQGEIGVGKEFVAREIHKQSRRKGKFVSFNLYALDDELFSEMIFGVKEKGSDNRKKGLLEEAKRGTLFLNDIGDLSMTSQSKLLHLLKKREYCPLNTDEMVPDDSRIVAATNKNLSALVKVGKFRKDLFYLLKEHEINIPPLRERKEDIFLLVTHFLKTAVEELGIEEPNVPKELFDILEKYDFPGNVSELKKMVSEAVFRYKMKFLPLEVFLKRGQSEAQIESHFVNMHLQGSEISTYDKVIFRFPIPTFNEMTSLYLNEILRRSKGDYTVAARLAGLNLNTFIHRLKNAKKRERAIK